MHPHIYVLSYYTDSVISSSAKRRRKCWSEVQHNESIEELFDKMAAAMTTKPSTANTTPAHVYTNNSGDVTVVEDEEHDRRENQCK